MRQPLNHGRNSCWALQQVCNAIQLRGRSTESHRSARVLFSLKCIQSSNCGQVLSLGRLLSFQQLRSSALLHFGHQ